MDRRDLLRATTAALLASGSARAADWPSRPISFVVPWAPGGGTDLIARAFATVLAEKLGQPVPVVNRAGGNGMVGHLAIAQAVPDGTTMGLISPQLLTTPILAPPGAPAGLRWQDLQPLALINVDAGAVTVRADAPWRDLQAFIAFGRANPEGLRIGNSGQGGTWHMVALELERRTGIKVIHTPYAGSAPGIRDMLGGHIEAVTFSATEARPTVASGQARMLAVTAPARLAALPEVPTAAEQGVPIDLGTWRGLAVPRGTPPAILAALEAAVLQAAADPRFTGFMASQGFGQHSLGAAGFTAYLAEQDTKYREFFSG